MEESEFVTLSKGDDHQHLSRLVPHFSDLKAEGYTETGEQPVLEFDEEGEEDDG